MGSPFCLVGAKRGSGCAADPQSLPSQHSPPTWAGYRASAGIDYLFFGPFRYDHSARSQLFSR